MEAAALTREEDEGDVGDRAKDPDETAQGSVLTLSTAPPPLNVEAVLPEIQLSASPRL